MGDAGECCASWEEFERTTCEIASHIVHEASRQQVLERLPFLLKNDSSKRKKTAETFDPTVMVNEDWISFKTFFHSRMFHLHQNTDLKNDYRTRKLFLLKWGIKTICCNCLRTQSARDSVLRLDKSTVPERPDLTVSQRLGFRGHSEVGFSCERRQACGSHPRVCETF